MLGNPKTAEEYRNRVATLAIGGDRDGAVVRSNECIRLKN